MKNKWMAFFLSLFIPGTGQLYLGERIKAVTMLCITAGLAVALATSRSRINFLFLSPICLFVMIPAATDAFQTASGEPRTFTSDSIPYVLFMLFAVGPFAVPLLWLSPKFSGTSKIILTALVIVIAIGAILFLKEVSSMMSAYLE